MRTLRTLSAVLLLTAFGGHAALQSQSSLSFNRIDNASNASPRSIVSADFNRDGFQDVALGGTNPASVGILFHHGLEDGDEGQRFKPLLTIGLNGGPFDMAAGDLNKDGWPDLAIANADLPGVSIILNVDGRSFSPPTDMVFDGNPRGLALADFNGDGNLDVVVTKFMGESVDVLYGAGDGSFPTNRSYPAPPHLQGVVAADLNNDGRVDAAAVSVAGLVSVFLMEVSGDAVRSDHSRAVGFNVITAGDFNRDGTIDLAYASTSRSVVEVMYRSPEGGAGWSSDPIPVAASPRGIETADMNGDGVLDLVAAGRAENTVTLLLRDLDTAETMQSNYTRLDLAAGIGARDVTLTDFSIDGRIDILTANEYANSTTLLWTVTPAAMSAYAFDRQLLPMQFDLRAFGVADFNGNGIPDIVLREHIYLDRSTPSRRFLNAFTEDGTIGDFNGDGRMDIVFATREGFSSSLRMFFGTGTGDVTVGPVISTGPTAARFMRAVDMNRDGRLDLVMRLSSGVEIWLGDGHGAFATATRVDIAAGWIEVTDVNRDGLQDLVALTSAGIETLLGDGAGGLRASATFGGGGRWRGFSVGDITGDGIVDLVAIEAQPNKFGSFVASAVAVARGNGDGAFEEYSRTAVVQPYSWSDFSTLLLADLNHDGGLDVFTGNGQFMIGGGTLLEPQLFAAQGSNRMHAVDMNGDGLLDIVGVGHDRAVGDPANMIMLNTRRTPEQNAAPTGVTLPDTVRYSYAKFFYAEDEPEIWAGFEIADPDVHAVRHRWMLEDGTVVFTSPFGFAPGPEMTPGRYPMRFVADDYRGGETIRDFTLEITPYQEAVVHPRGESVLQGAWQLVQDASANEGYRLWLPDINTPKIQAPLAEPVDHVDIGFLADPSQEYKLWIRLKADGDSWANDSVYVQFSGATDATGNAVYRMGTNSALVVNLEECSNCGIAGWGWEDDGWGAVDTNGVTLRFPEGGRQRLRIQAREDGVSIDTIVLSAVRYKTTRPGSAKNDNTLLTSTGPWMGTWWFQ